MRAWVEMPASTSAGPVPVLVDVDDYFAIGKRRLSLASHGYAQITPYGTGQSALLHRWLLGLVKGDGLIGDHKNGDKRDYRRNNLRTVDPSGSSQNVAGRGKSRFRGVHPNAHGGWHAMVKFRGQIHRLGTFDSEIDAARVAEAKRRDLLPHYIPRDEDLRAIYGEQMRQVGPLPVARARIRRQAA